MISQVIIGILVITYKPNIHLLNTWGRDLTRIVLRYFEYCSSNLRWKLEETLSLMKIQLGLFVITYKPNTHLVNAESMWESHTAIQIESNLHNLEYHTTSISQYNELGLQ